MLLNKNLKKILKITAESSLIYLALVLLLSFLSGSVVYLKTERLLGTAFIVVLISYLYKNRKEYFISWGILYCLLCSVVFPYFIVDEHQTLQPMIKYMNVVGCISCFVILTTSFISNKILKKSLFILYMIPLLLLVMIFWGYYFSMNATFAADTLLAVMQTNFREAKEYLTDYFSLQGSIAVLTVLLVGVGMWLNIKCLELCKENKYYLHFVFVLSLASLLICYSGRQNIVFKIFLDAEKNLQKYADFQKKQSERKNHIKTDLQIQKNTKGVYILVIGESQNKDNMSAYGYARKTTPWLEEAVQQNNFINFTKAYSCHTHTVPVLTYALTAKNQYNNLPLASSISIIEAAEAAGYETVWLSNQVKYSAWDTPITVIASEANQQSWLNRNIGETTGTSVYDLNLVNEIDLLKNSEKMLIVIHLMGNHGSYEERYPQNFAVFGSKGIDKYDNSILYNDYVVSKIYERVQKLSGFKCMIYFADHADAAKDGLGHDSGRFIWPMTHIPLYMVFSKDFMREEQNLIANLRNSSDKIFTNDLVFNLLLGIMRIKIPSLYEPENDITNTTYNFDVQRFKTLYGKKMIKDDLK